ncbi:hypothetical protein C9I43_00760 [Shewanella morhuae]|uniref:Lipoprotein n=1 Tax=Shewanella morhuae TaxID=365591 RepID=A0ABX5HR27_9GAMM|nr:hypothetical protein [Shewanella morhuae]PTA49155.1 hypothetical protein C9I43_00760 [Shewanella morhuae]
MEKMLLLILLIISGCSHHNVTDDEVIKHYYDNSVLYNELAKQSCSQFEDLASGEIVEITSNDKKYPIIANNLKQLERDSIYIDRRDGECSLQLIYFGEGAFNAVNVFYLNFNLKNPKLYDDKTDKASVRDKMERYYFDMPLSNGWYFSYETY